MTVDVTLTTSCRSARPPTEALADFSRYDIQLSSGTPLEMTWYRPLASASRAIGMLSESSVTCFLSCWNPAPSLPAMVLASFIAAVNWLLSAVRSVNAPRRDCMAVIVPLTATALSFHLLNAEAFFSTSACTLAIDFPISLMLAVAVTTWSLPSTDSRMLNFTSLDMMC